MKGAVEFAYFIVVLLTVTASLAAETQKERVAWSEVASATSGAKITMMLPSGTEIQGKVLEAEPQALISGRDQDFKQQGRRKGEGVHSPPLGFHDSCS